VTSRDDFFCIKIDPFNNISTKVPRADCGAVGCLSICLTTARAAKFKTLYAYKLAAFTTKHFDF